MKQVKIGGLSQTQTKVERDDDFRILKQLFSELGVILSTMPPRSQLRNQIEYRVTDIQRVVERLK